MAQAFEPEVLDWAEFAVVVRHEQVASLPKLLASVDLKAKQAALRKVWNRLVWRANLRGERQAKLPAPDAFGSTMEALATRLREEKRRRRKASRGG